MTLGQQLLFFFSAIGAFNGLLLGIYLLFVKKLKYIPEFFLGLLLLMLSIRVGISVCIYFYPELPRIIPQIGLSALFFVGPALYSFIETSFSQKRFSFTNHRKLYGLLILVLAIAGLLYLVYPNPFVDYYAGFIYAVWTGFILLSVYKYYTLSKIYAKKNGSFIIPVLVSNVIIFLTYQLISTGWIQIYCAGGSLVFSFVLYTNFLILFNKKHQSATVGETAKYLNRKISDEKADNFVLKLEQLMKTEELYKNPNLKLSDLAAKMNISAHQLSQLLNDNLEKSFSIYINEYRINEACEMIEKGCYLKIEEIGYEVGFNSKSTFFSTFKKLKQSTPQLYKNSLIV